MKITHQLTVKSNQQAIKCLICERVSCNPSDIEHLYCGCCNMFHEDREDIKQIIITNNKNKLCKLQQSKQSPLKMFMQKLKTNIYFCLKSMMFDGHYWHSFGKLIWFYLQQKGRLR